MGREEDPAVLRRTSFQDDLKGQRENKGTKKKGETTGVCAAFQLKMLVAPTAIRAMLGSHVEVFSPIGELFVWQHPWLCVVPIPGSARICVQRTQRQGASPATSSVSPAPGAPRVISATTSSSQPTVPYPQLAGSQGSKQGLEDFLQLCCARHPICPAGIMPTCCCRYMRM